MASVPTDRFKEFAEAELQFLKSIDYSEFEIDYRWLMVDTTVNDFTQKNQMSALELPEEDIKNGRIKYILNIKSA